MKKINYFIREEPFGYTFFDKKKLRHQFLGKKELESVLKEKLISNKEIEWLKIKRKDCRKDIIYSPIRIYYELTLACDLSCRYCFNSSGRPRKNELTTKQVLKNLDNLRENNVMDIRFTGGELTCRKDWYEILKYAKDLNFAVSCNTNAAFHDKKICKKFANLGLEQVTVSIDGNEEHHDFNRGKGVYKRTITNLKLMHDLGVRLRINTLVNKYSMNDVKHMLDLASKYTDEINFFVIVFIGRGDHLESSDGVSVEDHFKMSKEIKSLRKNYPNLNILHFAEVSRKTSVTEDVNKKFNLLIGPPSGFTTFNVMSHGGYCCGGYVPYIDSNLVIGNVKNNDIFDIWQKNKVLEKIRNDGGRLINFCNKCNKFKEGKCQGSKYEIELNRLVNPEVKNPTCIYGNGPSLLVQSKNA
jgi:MoaA/NifB/PqqE/SkfB family radical SAM enzyme